MNEDNNNNNNYYYTKNLSSKNFIVTVIKDRLAIENPWKDCTPHVRDTPTPGRVWYQWDIISIITKMKERKKNQLLPLPYLLWFLIRKPSFSPSSFSFHFLYFCANNLISNHFFRLLAVAPHQKTFFLPLILLFPTSSSSSYFCLFLYYVSCPRPPTSLKKKKKKSFPLYPPSYPFRYMISHFNLTHSFPGKNFRSKEDKFQNVNFSIT
jgi:hypothetical protein